MRIENGRLVVLTSADSNTVSVMRAAEDFDTETLMSDFQNCCGLDKFDVKMFAEWMIEMGFALPVRYVGWPVQTIARAVPSGEQVRSDYAVALAG